MAAENEIQFFEAPFQYQIGEFQSNVNLTYHKLINTRPIKMPQLNTWFETPFTQAYNEKWDKSYFWIKKREWFKICTHLDTILKKYYWLQDWYIIADHVIVEWQRFITVLNPEKTIMYVFKQEWWWYAWCTKIPDAICSWDWQRVRIRYRWEWSSYYFDTTPCAYHKILKVNTLQWYEKPSSYKKYYIWNYITTGWATTAVLYSENMEDTWISIWRRAQVSDAANTDIVVWQALQVWKFDAEQWRYNMWYGSWIWVTDEFSRPVYDSDWNEIWTLNYQWPITLAIYDNVKPWIAVMWIDWDTAWVWEYDWERFNVCHQTELNWRTITSITEDSWWVVYSTSEWVLNFMRPYSDVWQNLSWTIYSTHQMHADWDLIKSIWDYVFLIWPNSMWIAYKNWTDERWDYRWEVQTLSQDLWYYSQTSVLVFNEELYMVDNKKRFIKIDLEATTDSYYRVHFKLQTTDMSLHWINTDLRNLCKECWDIVALCKDDYRIYIIIQDNPNASWDEYVNTKILVYEDELKYRHWRYLCWVDIRYFSEWQRIWKWLWLNEWEEDNWHPFKQIISMTFWDTSWFTWKEILWIKAAIWYHSKISENTIFKFRADGWWYSTTFKMTDIHKTSNYIKAINSLRESWKTNMDDLQELYRAMPIGIWIYSWNWVWLIEDKYRTPQTEFDQFCNYEPTTTYKIDTCCDDKPASEADGNGCTMKSPDADKENFGSDRLQYHYNVAKYSTIKINVWQQWQNFYFELIANEYDSIEFCWFMIWWMFMDNNFDSIANTPYYQTTPKDSLPWMMWK